MKEKSLTKNFIFYMVKTIFSVIVPLIMIPYASRILGPSGIGKVQYAQSWATYFQLTASLGISSYAIREGASIRDDSEKLGKFCTEILILSFVSTSISLMFYFLFVFFTSIGHSYFYLLLVFSVFIIGSALNTEWLCSVLEDYDYISKRYIILQLLAFILLFILVKDSSDFVQYAIILVFPVVASSILNFIHCRKKVRWFGYKKYEFLVHLRPIIYIFGIGLTSTIYTTLDSTMLGYLIGDHAVGLYTSASRFTKSMISLVNASCTVFLPRLAYYTSFTKRDKFVELANKAVSILLIFSIPCCFGLFILAPECIYFFSGSDFGEAVQPLRILSIDLFFATVNGFLAWQILVPLKKEKLLLVATIIGAVIDALINLIFIPVFGVSGAAFATLITEITVFGIMFKYCPKNIFSKKKGFELIQYILASTTFLIINILVRSIFKTELLIVIINIIVCVFTYTIVLYLCNNPTIFMIKNKLINLMRV